jgi:hypothetical protein
MQRSIRIRLRDVPPPGLVRPMEQLLELHSPVGQELIWMELEPRLWEAILQPGRVVGRDLPVVGMSETPQAPAFWQQQPDRSWLFAADYRQDPTFAASPGKIVMPRAELQAFDALAAAGLNCDLIWIAHELPATWQPGHAIPRVPDPPRARRHRRVLDTIANGSRVAIREGTRTALQVGAAVAVLPAIGLVGLVGLDPVVLGGLVHEETGAVVWVELARWDWE